MTDAEFDATEMWLRTQRGETWPGSRQHSGAEQALSRFEELRETHRLLGLIERHGWTVQRIGDLAGGDWVVGRLLDCEHVEPTLIEALTEASKCNRCCGRTE